jgi:AraC-like DNA-binding protein
VDHVVEQVLSTARSRLSEQLTVDDLAQMAMFSKFHFARMFRQVTGLSPRRFLSAMRLQEAKRLLVTTSLSVADISHQVGYNSVGTFTSRFTASVGVPPTVFRRLRGRVPSLRLDDPPPDPAACAAVTGRVTPPESALPEAAPTVPAPTFVGVFRGPAPEGWPAGWAVLPRPGEWAFPYVPEGRWYVVAVSRLRCPSGIPVTAVDDGATSVGVRGPLVLRAGSPVAGVEVQLRPMRPTDPPILFALTELADPETGEEGDRAA